MAQSKLASLGKRYRNEFQACHVELHDELEQQAKRQRKQTQFLPFYTLLTRFEHENKGSETAGDRRLAEFRRVLDQFKWTRSPDQVWLMLLARMTRVFAAKGQIPRRVHYHVRPSHCGGQRVRSESATVFHCIWHHGNEGGFLGHHAATLGKDHRRTSRRPIALHSTF